MRYFFTLLLTSLLCTCASAQVNIRIATESDKLEESGELNIIVSDSSAIQIAAAQEAQRAATQYARLIRRINNENWKRTDRLIGSALEDFGLEIDTFQNQRWSYLVDTFTMRVRTTDLTPKELTEFTDASNPDDVINIEVRGFFNNAGRLVLRPIGGGSGVWPVFMKGNALFDVRRMPGVDNFYLQYSDERRRIYRDDSIGPWKAIMIIR